MVSCRISSWRRAKPRSRSKRSGTPPCPLPASQAAPRPQPFPAGLHSRAGSATSLMAGSDSWFPQGAVSGRGSEGREKIPDEESHPEGRVTRAGISEMTVTSALMGYFPPVPHGRPQALNGFPLGAHRVIGNQPCPQTREEGGCKS